MFIKLFIGRQLIYIPFKNIIRMKKILLSIAMLCMALSGRAETQSDCVGWPANYDGVMLQGFWWDSYDATKWTNLTARADELSQYFDLIWVPNSGTCSDNPEGVQGKSMGYDPCFWLSHNSCFGTETELRTMINTYKQKGVGIIEDVVINHKKGRTNWCDFPDEPWTSEGPVANPPIKWSADYSEITCNDDCNFPGSGYVTKGGYDTGDDFPGFRDLDHTSEVTQNNIKTYLDFLLNDLGYAGFRYDLVKGYAAGYIQKYNNSAKPEFSVGEYWDNQTNIQNWIMGTGNTSAAFDFPLKYKLNQAISDGDYSAFAWKSFTYDPQFSQYSVTFADNHDSGREDHSKLVNNWSAANAFILASPGTPCIWYPHYNADPTNIQAMILARKACGITNTNCSVNGYATDNNSGYVMESFGSKGSLYVLLGQAAYSQTAPSNYTLVAEGNAYKFYSTKADFGYVKVSPDGGPFTTDKMEVTLTAVNVTNPAVDAWYKIGDNGSVTYFPNNSTTVTVEIGEGVAANTDITIYWGATGGDNVEHTGSATFTKRNAYPTASFEEGENVGVFFETDAREVYFYAWGGDLSMAWNPESNMELMGLNDAGKLVYKWTYNGSLDNLPTGLLFIADGNQTADFEFVNHGYYSANGLSYYMGTKTVYFDNSVSNWDKVYYYAWDNQGRNNADWPGKEVTKPEGDDYYTVSVEGFTSIIFNNPNAQGLKQTDDLVVEDGKVYKLEANTVAFNKSGSNWNKVYYYAFTDDEVQKTKWPGEEITAPNSAGNYEVTLLKDYSNVIFNDGNGGIAGVNQTADLKAVDGETYALNTNTVYFDKTGTNWGDVRYYAFNVLNGVDRTNMGWPGEVISTTTSDGRFEVTLPEGYNYVIFDNGNGGEVGVSQTADLKVEGGKTYTISSPSSVRSVVLLGQFNGWSKENVLKESPENTWTYLLNLGNTTDDTEFKLLVNGNQWLGYSAMSFNAPDGWIAQASSDDNILLKNSSTFYKTYQVTISWTPSTDITAGWNITVEGVDARYATYTVYFDNTESNWDKVYYYAYTDNGTPKAAWPGELIEQPNPDELYEANLLEIYTTVIFNCGKKDGSVQGVDQTYDLPVVDGKVYTLSGGANTQDGYTVYFDNSSSNWANVYYYTWGDSGNKAAWPGEVTTETNDQGYYVVHVDGTAYNMIIFNNGQGAQTQNFEVEDGRVYTSTGMTTALILSDDKPFFNDETFTASSVTYTREMSYSWGTIIMPFELTSDDNVQYYEITSVDGEVMTLDMIESVPAGEPAVFKLVNGPGTLEINATNVDVVPTADENKYGTGVSSWYMNGTYQGKSNVASTGSNFIYYIARDQFWLAEEGYPVSAAPFRAWFETTNAINAAKLRIAVGGEAEGIQTIEEDKNQGEIIYDLMGRQQDWTRKGIVIKNGSVIFVK